VTDELDANVFVGEQSALGMPVAVLGFICTLS